MPLFRHGQTTLWLRSARYDFIPAPASAGVTILRGHKHFIPAPASAGVTFLRRDKHFRFYIGLRFFAEPVEGLRMTALGTQG